MTTRQRVPYDDLRGYLKLLEDNGMLKRITAEVDLDGELGAIAYRDLVRDGPGLLFENVKDYPDMPLVANVMYREDQLALALNGDPDWASLRDIIHEGMQHRMPSKQVPTGPVKDVKIMGEDVDLDMLPTPRWHEEDGGRYIGTTAGFVTRDPQTGNLNMGQYRSMIIDKNTTTVEIMGDWAVGATPPQGSNYGGTGDRNGATHVLENEANGLPTPCAIVLGMDPLLTLSCGTAVPHDENGHGEYEAGGRVGRPSCRPRQVRDERPAGAGQRRDRPGGRGGAVRARERRPARGVHGLLQSVPLDVHGAGDGNHASERPHQLRPHLRTHRGLPPPRSCAPTRCWTC